MPPPNLPRVLGLGPDTDSRTCELPKHPNDTDRGCRSWGYRWKGGRERTYKPPTGSTEADGQPQGLESGWAPGKLVQSPLHCPVLGPLHSDALTTLGKVLPGEEAMQPRTTTLHPGPQIANRRASPILVYGLEALGKSATGRTAGIQARIWRCGDAALAQTPVWSVESGGVGRQGGSLQR